jgi:beta-glucosidase
MFLPGQEFGNALGEVLFGVKNPSGRLPITIPHQDRQMTFENDQWPGVNGIANYSEGLLNGYRWYDHHNVKPHFAFGHGLGYSAFDYQHVRLLPKIPFLEKWELSVKVVNLGKIPGHEVVQAYLVRHDCKHPNKFIRPPKKLVAFKRQLVPANSHTTFHLSFGFDQVAHWSTKLNKFEWPSDHCKYSLAVGASSQDIRHTVNNLHLAWL